jgi:hypothetical protein
METDYTTFDKLSDGELVAATTPKAGRSSDDYYAALRELARRARSVEATERVRWSYLFALLEQIANRPAPPTARDIAHRIHMGD